MRRVLLFLLLCITILTGCGKNEDGEERNPEPIADWKEGFAVSGEITENQEFWIQEFLPLQYDEEMLDPETEAIWFYSSLSQSCTYGSKLYRLNIVRKLPYSDPSRWFLYEYDAETMESKTREVTLEMLKQQDTEEIAPFLIGMNVINEDEFVFQWAEMGKNEEGKYHPVVNRMIYTDLHGQTDAADLLEPYLQMNIVRDEVSEQGILLPTGYCVCDGQGNTYVRAGHTDRGYTKLYAFDRKGQAVLEYQCDENHVVEEPLRMETGEIVYSVYNFRERNYSFLWADTSTGKMCDLGKLENGDRIVKFYGMQGNSCYYQARDGIIRWNLKSGERNLCFSFQENGIPSSFDTMMIFRKDAPPMLRMYQWGNDKVEDWLIVLSDTEVSRDKDVKIVALAKDTPGIKQVSECATICARKDFNHLFSLTNVEEKDAEDYRTKVFAEMVAGGGPDLMYVTRADMEILWEKGLLVDMNELLSEETREKILPGVLQMGTREGQLVGLAGHVQVDGMAVSKDTWTQSTWRLEDIISMMESGKIESTVFYAGPNIFFRSLAVQNMLTNDCLEDSFLIDWEKRESHFTDERFIKLLELTKKGDREGEDESGTIFNGGSRIAFFSVCTPEGVCDAMRAIEAEGGFCVGFPNSGTGGNYLVAENVLVVNANSKHKEEIALYLETFLGESVQKLLENWRYEDLSVCKLTPVEMALTEKELAELTEEERRKVVEEYEQAKADREAAEAFLESCVPEPRQYPDINRILYEEFDAMNNGDKDARQVAEIIHKRVQIYLDEE